MVLGQHLSAHTLKDLQSLSTRALLSQQEVDAHVGDALQQLVGRLRVLVQERLEQRLGAAAAALDHVAHERERGAHEADERHLTVDLLARQVERVQHVAQRLLDVGVQVELVDVLGRADRVGQHGPHLGHHLDLHAHGLRDHENVREDDDRVHVVAAQRLQTHFHRQLGHAAHGEEVVAHVAQLAELGQVAVVS